MQVGAPSEVWPREMPVSRGVTQGRFPGGTPELWRGPSQPRPVQRLRGARRVGVAWLVPCPARAVSGDGCPGGLLLGWAPGSRGWRAAEISRRGRKRGHHLAVQQAGSRPLPGGKPPSPAAALRSRVPPLRDQPQHPLGWVAEARTRSQPHPRAAQPCTVPGRGGACGRRGLQSPRSGRLSAGREPTSGPQHTQGCMAGLDGQPGAGGQPWPGRWSQAPLRVGPGPGRPRRCPSVPQRLVDEQLSRKQTLYALCFGAAARALWPDPVDVSASV